MLAGGLTSGAVQAAAPDARPVGLPPRMNVVFLDDRALDLPPGVPMRQNHWREWDRRLPGFPHLLTTYVARFQRALGTAPKADDTLFALELAAGLSPKEREQRIFKELDRIFQTTRRPSAVLARSTAGRDQLRLVYQDAADYSPEDAARFLRLLAAISPPVACRRLAQSFGPFQPPPTLIFDPRPSLVVAPEEQARQRWGLLENDVYLLPHYLLHTLALLNEATDPESGTFYSSTLPDTEAGSIEVAFVQYREQAKAMSAEAFSRGGITNGRSVYVEKSNNGKYQVEGLGGRGNRRTFNSTADINRELMKHGEFTVLGVAANVSRREVDQMKGNKTLTAVDGFGDQGPRAVLYGQKASSINVFQGSTLSSFLNRHPELNKAPIFVPVGRERGGIQTMSKNLVDSKRVMTYQPGVKWVETGRSLHAEKSGSIKGEIASKLGIPESSVSGRSSSEIRARMGVTIQFSRASTFSPDFNNARNRGGILLGEGNLYVMDLTGRVRREGDLAEEASRAGKHTFDLDGQERIVERMRMTDQPTLATAGAQMAPLPAFDSLILLQLDLKRPYHRTLPVAVPRFLADKGDSGPRFGGPWTFEPVVLQRVPTTGQAKEMTAPDTLVVPAETATYLPYTLEDQSDRAGAAIPEVRHYTKLLNYFQPDLTSRGSRFTWTLRHGVSIDLDSTGLVQAIRAPNGASIIYARDGGQLSGQQINGNGVIRIDGPAGQPNTLTLREGSSVPLASVQYSYEGGLLTGVAGGQRQVKLAYEAPDQLASLTAAPFQLMVNRIPARKLTTIQAGPLMVSLEFLAQARALRITAGGQRQAVSWRFGPKNRVVGIQTEDKAVWWVWGVDGRIIQMAQGDLGNDGAADTKFRVHKTIGVH
jgi:hypothetical protein